MKPSFLEKLAAIERSLSREKGDFEVFGVVLPEASLEQWDLIVAAPWLDSRTLQSYRVVAAPLQATFTPDDWLAFSRIVSSFWQHEARPRSKLLVLRSLSRLH